MMMAAFSEFEAGDRYELLASHRGPGVTPISSASMPMAATIIHTIDVAMSFGRFVELAILFAALQNALVTRCTPSWSGGKLMPV